MINPNLVGQLVEPLALVFALLPFAAMMLAIFVPLSADFTVGFTLWFVAVSTAFAAAFRLSWVARRRMEPREGPPPPTLQRIKDTVDDLLDVVGGAFLTLLIGICLAESSRADWAHNTGRNIFFLVMGLVAFGFLIGGLKRLLGYARQYFWR